MNLRQAAHQALEAINAIPEDVEGYLPESLTDAVVALRAALAEPEQEPVAWMWRCKPFCNWPEWNVSLKRPADSGRDGNTRTEGYEDVPLYTAPTPRKPLTVFEIDAIAEHLDKTTIGWATHEFAAAIEKAHGIGEQHE